MSQFRKPMFGTRLRGYARGTRARKGIRAPLSVGISLVNLIAYYTLSDLNDSSGNNRTLTNNGSATFVAGKVGNAVSEVQGGPSSQYLSSTDSGFDLAATPFTLAIWVKATSFDANRQYAINKMDTVGTGVGYALRVNAAGVPSFLIPAAEVIWGSALVIGTWYFLCARWDRANGTMYLRVNDAADVSLVTAQDVSNEPGITFTMGSWAGAAFHWNGQLDECAIFNRYLLDPEVAYLYNNGVGRTWPL